MTFLKRYSVFCGVLILAGLYYLLASLNILQFFRFFPSELFHALNNILIEVTKPVALSVISILAYFTGLIIRRNNAELWSQRLILICVLIIALPLVLPFFMGTRAESAVGFATASSAVTRQNAAAGPAASPASNFDALLMLARDGDMESILTVARLYCLGCDTAVKLDLRVRDATSIAANENSADLSKYQRPDEDIKEAFTWYEAAARMGSLKARNILGEMLVHGVGVLQDMGKAFRLFNDAAKQGYVPARLNLAAMYEYGYGVDKDIVQAHMWYNIVASAAKDHADEDALYAKVLRDSLESKMGTLAIAEASEKARVCMGSKFQNCR